MNTRHPLERLDKAAYNPRVVLKRDDPIFISLKKSIVEFSDTVEGRKPGEYRLPLPIVANRFNNRVVGGHQRIKALEALGQDWVHTEDLRWLNITDESRESALNVALNKIGADERMWDRKKLAIVLDRIEVTQLDIEITGFQTPDIDPLLKGLKRKEREIPEERDPPKKPKAKTGQIFELGQHRIMCGDSTNRDDVTALMNDQKAALFFSDPPYGVEYKPYGGKRYTGIEGDDKVRDDFSGFLTEAFKAAVRWTTPKAAFYIWHASVTLRDFLQAMQAAGLEEREYIVWAKPAATLGWADYRWAHEPCFYAGKTGTRPAFYADRTEETVWRVGLNGGEIKSTVIGPGILISDGNGHSIYVQEKGPRKKRTRHARVQEKEGIHLHRSREDGTVWEVKRDRGVQHPTQKPVELAVRAIENSSKRGEIVLDLFLGAGGTLLGAEETGRRCYGMEKDPAYIDVTIGRWEEMTGEKARPHGR